MIKVNLTTAKKQLDISNVGGFDFSKLKIKAMILVIILIYLPDFFLVPAWEEERNTTNAMITLKQKELSKLKRKVSESTSLDKQIRELKAQEENLGKKLTAVKQAISEKRNPASLLLYIAKNIPDELWIRDLQLDMTNMTIKGEALDYQSIGKFITILKSSVFIKDANIVSSNSITREPDRKRIEVFEVKFDIARFDQ
jgi:Tfp pilus assembly protein PilN